MRNIVYLPSLSVERSVAFYVDALGLFEVADDLGMGSILLRFKRSPDFFLMTSPEVGPRSDDAPLFSIDVGNCASEFERVKQRLVGQEALSLQPQGPIEYPLGKFLKMRDPSGNVFVLYEWHL